jgi:hypothetical protein
VSRDLGTVQRRALAIIGAADAGVSVIALATLLSRKPRRTRKIVASLVRRGLVVDAIDPRLGRLIWIPEQRRAWLAAEWRSQQEREYIAAMIDRLAASRRPGSVCPTCGQRLSGPQAGPQKRMRPVE